MSETIGTIDTPSQQAGLEKVQHTDTRNILGVDVRVISRTSAFRLIESTVENGQHQKFAFLNAHGANIAYNNPLYCKQLEEFIVLADGIGIDIASEALYGQKFPDNLNGTDFIPRLFDHIKKPMRIGLLGGERGVAEQAGLALKHNHPIHDFIPISHGYFGIEDQPGILKTLEDSHLDILMVAFGNPTQERWIVENCKIQHAVVPIGVGAFFDFSSGRVRRAPKWILKMRMEWLYRLCLEPSRMWRRYLFGNPLFLARIYRQKLFGLSTCAKGER